MWLRLGHDFAGAGWHLQHCGVLPSGQFRQQDDLTVWQFQSVMMNVRLVLIDLPKPGNLVLEAVVAEAIGRLAFQALFKGKLRARKQANGDILARQPQRNPAC